MANSILYNTFYYNSTYETLNLDSYQSDYNYTYYDIESLPYHEWANAASGTNSWFYRTATYRLLKYDRSLLDSKTAD